MSGAVSDDTVAFAAELIDRSGTAPVIEAALAHTTGRRGALPVRLREPSAGLLTPQVSVRPICRGLTRSTGARTNRTPLGEPLPASRWTSRSLSAPRWHCNAPAEPYKP